MTKIKSIMLIDDNPNDNFFHQRVISKFDKEIEVQVNEDAVTALEKLKNSDADESKPDIIFLDINMPIMNGWEFLEEYRKLLPTQQTELIIIMLTTSDNPADIALVKQYDFVSDFRTKPLTIEMIKEIEEKYFPN
jgi:CheY-like chemotaxis protein